MLPLLFKLKERAMYPLQSLIYRTLGTSSKQRARSLLAEKLGNQNRNKAFKRAEQLLTEPVIAAEFAVRLAEALALPREVVLAAVDQGAHQIQQERDQAYFKAVGPHLYVETRGPVTSATFAAMTHQRLKIIQLPREIVEESFDWQLDAVKQTVVNSQRKAGKILPIFGEILGYKYFPTLTSGFNIDLSGNLIQCTHCRPHPPSCNIGIGGRHYDYPINIFQL